MAFGGEAGAALRAYYIDKLDKAYTCCMEGTLLYTCLSKNDSRCSAERETDMFTYRYAIGRLLHPGGIYVCPRFFPLDPLSSYTVVHELGRWCARIWDADRIAKWDNLVDSLDGQYEDLEAETSTS